MQTRPITDVEEHPFARFVRILGKGPTLSRPLTLEETVEAARMILNGQVEPVQLGAYLCLLRMHGETPEEVAGFVKAARETLAVPAGAPAVDLDWPCYAGKRRRSPWFLLSALLLVENGIKVFMHGLDGHTPGRLYTGTVLTALGLPPADSLETAARVLENRGFAYLSLERISAPMHAIMGLKPILGLRSPLHTMARKLNPFSAPAQIIGVAHPPYRDLHQGAAHLLGQPRMAVLKGEGGEAERRPEKVTEVFRVEGDALFTEEWPALFAHAAQVAEGDLDPARLAALWWGESEDPVATAVVTGTAAVALKLLGRADTPAEADALARELWTGRRRGGLPGAGGAG
ncbi:MAG TPA: glycosyl transferase family protein [Azospirillaceae bacterium]|nr:glycosyl transferase family protein [Azospirillaceae bacterium]